MWVVSVSDTLKKIEEKIDISILPYVPFDEIEWLIKRIKRLEEFHEMIMKNYDPKTTAYIISETALKEDKK